MKKIIISIGIVTALGIFVVLEAQKQNCLTLSSVALANIEALASGEGTLQAPCKKEDNQECTFEVKDVSGNTGQDTWFGYIYHEIK